MKVSFAFTDGGVACSSPGNLAEPRRELTNARGKAALRTDVELPAAVRQADVELPAAERWTAELAVACGCHVAAAARRV